MAYEGSKLELSTTNNKSIFISANNKSSCTTTPDTINMFVGRERRVHGSDALTN